MATYRCNKCEMSLNDAWGKCDDNLVNNNLELDNGSNVQFSKCPNGHGVIKTLLYYG